MFYSVFVGDREVAIKRTSPEAMDVLEIENTEMWNEYSSHYPRKCKHEDLPRITIRNAETGEVLYDANNQKEMPTIEPGAFKMWNRNWHSGTYHRVGIDYTPPSETYMCS